jgi:hypothetical protein
LPEPVSQRTPRARLSFSSVFGERGFARLDRILSWVLGGYSSISVVQRREIGI